ncbi:hypothetical protein [uncultured Sunxiuqinia sp.]|uniref:hypothetical protein n=1 Tax=uncultured Sunxiuqinia sp. TaxID=1573825 RepID=UPI002AA6EA71|nr:hypothetical protein [uncultured Sunxiuqinia sp.]
MKIYYFFLKILRQLYFIVRPDAKPSLRNWKMFSDKEYANDLIYNALLNDEPCMVARFGSTEMLNLVNYIGVKHKNRFKNYKTYIQGKTPPWWWEQSTIDQLNLWSGFFPAQKNKVEEFCELFLSDIKQVDILGSWLMDEQYFNMELRSVKKVVLEDLEPFFASNPWTKALKGKKVLIVHPFVETIERQYQKRELLFENELLPEFELKTLKAVQSIAGSKTQFSDWFEALDFMKQQIDSIDYDICIVGAGAYGFSLAAHVKRKGKKAIHLAGATQLLFGIIGKRWEEFVVWPYSNLFNEHWVRPGETERPQGANKVEGACYW